MPDPLEAIAEAKRDDARQLDAIFREVTGWSPRLWGKMIGYGLYRYQRIVGAEGARILRHWV